MGPSPVLTLLMLWKVIDTPVGLCRGSYGRENMLSREKVLGDGNDHQLQFDQRPTRFLNVHNCRISFVFVLEDRNRLSRFELLRLPEA